MEYIVNESHIGTVLTNDSKFSFEKAVTRVSIHHLLTLGRVAHPLCIDVISRTYHVCDASDILG